MQYIHFKAFFAHLPFSIGVDGAFRPSVEDVRGANVTALFVVVLRVGVSVVVVAVALVLPVAVVMLVSVALLLGLGQAVNQVVSRLVGDVAQQTVHQVTVAVQFVLNRLAVKILF